MPAAAQEFDESAPLVRLRALRSFIRREFAVQRDNLFLWAPVFLAFGIGLYFALPVEPMRGAGVLALSMALLLLGCVRGRLDLRSWGLILVLAALGFCAAQLRTHLVHTPILQRDIGPVGVTGDVEAIEDLGGEAGIRVVLSHLIVEKLAPEKTPRMTRLRVKKTEGYEIGRRVDVLAQLIPPSPPVMPGGFDFQRYLYFQGIGAVGFVYKFRQAEPAPPSGLTQQIENWRVAVGRRIGAALPGDEAATATALINGRQTSISDSDKEAMRDAGLAHLLSISGLHIGLFAGVVFFSVRLALACVPGMALRHPIKKYAAILAIAAACFYTLLAGASIPAVRSLIMAGIVFLAILVDRSPISLRLVAFAAFAVLLLYPESLLSASFHMSFAAVAMLVVFYEWIRPFWSDWHRQAGAVKRAALYLAGVCMTSLVAGTATMPFALYHFQQSANYGLIANMIAVPVTGFLIMPSAVMALFLMPFGLEYWPLQVMGAGVEIILKVAHQVADLPYAVSRVSFWPVEALALFTFGALFLILWKGHLRVMGLIPVILSLVIILVYKQPDILVSSEFKLMAYRGDDQILHISGRRNDRFALESWERAMGFAEGSSVKWPDEGRAGPMVCGADGCRMEIRGRKIAFIRRPEILREECFWADLILSFNALNKKICAHSPADIRDRRDGYRNGAYTFWIGEGGVIQRNVEDLRGARPWSSLNLAFSPFGFSDSSAAD